MLLGDPDAPPVLVKCPRHPVLRLSEVLIYRQYRAALERYGRPGRPVVKTNHISVATVFAPRV